MWRSSCTHLETGFSRRFGTSAASPTKLLLVSTVFPEASSSAAGVRDYQLLASLKRFGVTDVLVVSPARETKHQQHAETTLGVRTQRVAANDDAFDALVREYAPHVAVFDRFIMEEQFGWRVRRASPHTLRVLDTQDLHFMRRARGQLVDAGAAPALVEAAALRLDPRDATLCRELASMHRSDVVWVVSSYEQHLITSHLGVDTSKVALAPFLYDNALIARHVHSTFTGRRPFDQRSHFVTLGNFQHAPNVDSVSQLRNQVRTSSGQVDPIVCVCVCMYVCMHVCMYVCV
jgi:hypothetical protein